MYLIPLLFIVAESLASMLPAPPPLPPCAVQFPGDPHSFPGWPGWRQHQSGASREQTRVSFTAFLQHAHRAQTGAAPPHLTCLPLRCTETHGGVGARFNVYLHIYILSSFLPIRATCPITPPPLFFLLFSSPGRRQTTMRL